MTSTRNAAIVSAILATAAATPAFATCTSCGNPTPTNPTTSNTVTGIAAPTAVASPTAIAAPTAAAQAGAQASAGAQANLAAQQNLSAQQNLAAQQNLTGKQEITGSQTQNISGPVGTSDAKAAVGPITIDSHTEAAKIPVATANPGVAIAAGLCGYAGGTGGQGVTFGMSINISGQKESCRTYFMLMANGLGDAATVYGMQNIDGFAKAMSGAADVEDAKAANPNLGNYGRFRAITVPKLD